MERGAYCYGNTQNRATEKVGKSFMEEVSFKLVLKQEMVVSQSGEWEMYPHWNGRMISSSIR